MSQRLGVIERRRHLIRLVEAAYQIELGSQEWLDNLAEVLGSMRGAEQGLMVYLYDARQPVQGAKISAFALQNLDEEYAQAVVSHNMNASPRQLRQKFRRGIVCGTVSEILAPLGLTPSEHPAFRWAQKFHRAEDSWGVSASNPDGCGVGISAPLAEVTSVPEPLRELWGLVGVHLATAHRLREARRGDSEGTEAVLGPDGRLEHAEGRAAEDEARAALGRAARLLDRARSAVLRRKPLQALALWKGLVAGRWSLVDRWDSDGRHFLEAHANEPRFDEPAELTPRERQVVVYAGQGDSDATIAYTLGYGEDTVATLLDSAMRKLDVDSRAELAEFRDSSSEE